MKPPPPPAHCPRCGRGFPPQWPADKVRALLAGPLRPVDPNLEPDYNYGAADRAAGLITRSRLQLLERNGLVVLDAAELVRLRLLDEAQQPKGRT